MDHRLAPVADSTSEHARLALQPREVRFCDLAPSLNRRVVNTPLRHEKRSFRPTLQRVARTKVPPTECVEAESGDDDERRRGRRRGPLEVGTCHGQRIVKPVTARSYKTVSQSDGDAKRMEISGNAVWGEDYGVSAVNSLAVLENCVMHERRLKEELAGVHAAKLLAFRNVIGIYLASVKQLRGPALGRRKAGAEFALAQCAVVAQTLILTIQSYIRVFQSRGRTAVLRCLRYRTLDPSSLDTSSAGMPHFMNCDYSDALTLTETTSSLHELLDEEEISRLKQLYFDYHDCDIYVIPGTRPDSCIPSDALLLDSLSVYDPFLPDEDCTTAKEECESAFSETQTE